MLKFNLPIEEEGYKYAVHGYRYAATIQELEQYLSNLKDYSDSDLVPIDDIIRKITELLHNHDITLH